MFHVIVVIIIDLKDNIKIILKSVSDQIVHMSIIYPTSEKTGYEASSGTKYFIN